MGTYLLGIKFLPGGFRPLIAGRVSALRGRVVLAADLINAYPQPLVRAVTAARHLSRASPLLEA